MDATKGIEDRIAALEESCLAIRRLAHELNQPLTSVRGHAHPPPLAVAHPETQPSVQTTLR